MCGGSAGRVAAVTMARVRVMASPIFGLGPEGSRRNVALDVGMLEGVELHPQHVALETDGVDAGFLLIARLGVVEDVLQSEVGVAWCLREPAPEVGHHFLVDEG